MPLTLAVSQGKNEIVSSILEYAKKDDIVFKKVLNDSANDLFWDIFNTNNSTRKIFGISAARRSSIDQWANCFLNKPNIADEIFKTGKFKFIFTKKEADELAKKINKGEYQEVINTIKTRQAVILGICAAALTLIAVGIAVAAILGGGIVAAGLISHAIGGAIFGSIFILLGILCVKYSELEDVFVGILSIGSGVFLSGAVAYEAYSIAAAAGVDPLAAAIGVGIMPLAAIAGVIGLVMLGSAIYHWSKKIEVATELNKEGQTESNLPNEGGIAAEQGPDAAVNQIVLEKGTGEEQETNPDKRWYGSTILT